MTTRRDIFFSFLIGTLITAALLAIVFLVLSLREEPEAPTVYGFHQSPIKPEDTEDLFLAGDAFIGRPTPKANVTIDLPVFSDSPWCFFSGEPPEGVQEYFSWGEMDEDGEEYTRAYLGKCEEVEP